MPAEFLKPGVFPSSVGALMSTRAGGVSAGPFASLNLRPWMDQPGHDSPEAVASNQQRFALALEGARPVWLSQVHGIEVHRLSLQALSANVMNATDATSVPLPVADATFTTEAGLACTVLVADCLPVLLASRDGSVVGAAHAGWRGLAAGVLEATVAAMAEASGVPPEDFIAWLGACIGPTAFEVGDEVRQAFVDAQGPEAGECFQPVIAGPSGERRPGKWMADLQRLALQRLRRMGISHWEVAKACTFSEPERFFSFRRESVTGRHAAAIWRRG